MTEETPTKLRPEEIPAYRNWKFWAGCLISLAVVSAVGYWAWNVLNASPAIGMGIPTPSVSTRQPGDGGVVSSLPTVPNVSFYSAISRAVDPHTSIPDRGSSWVTEYIVQRGDTLSGIAMKFKLSWQSILWGNTDTLKDDPNFLQPGQVLYILPVDGMFYKWQMKDTLESIAAEYNTTVDAIVGWPGNDLNPLDPVIPANSWVILPGGSRPFSWEAPMISNGSSKTFALGPGTCPGAYDGTSGSGVFRWPTANHNLSGYDYSAMHRGIDIYVYLGQPIYAADAGVVVFAGWSDRGYGDLVIIDHLNGFHTFYAHMSQWNVNCGQQVYAGTVVGLGGTTGNSTGPHLHFELLENGIRLDPNYYLS